jgi:hypothetical protein
MPGEDQEFRTDYPREPIGGDNPYWRCSCCGKSDPAINGRVDGHWADCSWRIEQESVQAQQKGSSNDVR